MVVFRKVIRSMDAHKSPSTIIVVAFAIVLATLALLSGGKAAEPAAEPVAGLAAEPAQEPETGLSLAPESILPEMVLTYADERTIEAYRFAAAHPDLLAHQPCYCGCNMIHDSNQACFISDIAPDGAIEFDMHASGCGVCVDIALDVKRLTEEGQTQLEIRHYIDATYGDIGPGTDTEMPEE